MLVAAGSTAAITAEITRVLMRSRQAEGLARRARTSRMRTVERRSAHRPVMVKVELVVGASQSPWLFASCASTR